MNTKFQFVIVVALLAVLLQSFTSRASAALVSEPTGAYASIPRTRCEEMIDRIDIAARRSDYAAMDRLIAECSAVAGVHFSIPVTGRALTAAERFLALKDHQAELLDRSGAAGVAAGYRDTSFMKFKDRQAEGRMP